MRFYLDLMAGVPSPMDLTIKMADAVFPYGWEYLGALDKLVQTTGTVVFITRLFGIPSRQDK